MTNAPAERAYVPSDEFPDGGYASEFDEAVKLAHEGDPWPLAILDFKSGDSTGLEALIVDGAQASPSPTVREFVASIVSGKYKATKYDKAIKHRAKVLFMVAFLADMLEAKRSDGENTTPVPFSTIYEMYEFIGAKMHMTPEAIAQIVKRNRKRLARDTSGTMTP